MSFISQHIAHQTGTVDPSTGKPAHYKGHTERLGTETVQDADGNHVPLKPYEHQEYPKMLVKGNETRIVSRKDAHVAAKAEGWKETA